MDIDHDTGYAVVFTARAFMRVSESRLRPLGLGVAQLPALVALAEQGTLTQREIARRTHVEQPTAAALLQRMDAAGLIERSPDPRDRRTARLSLSARARALLPDAVHVLGRVNAAATAGLSAAELDVLRDLLQRVLANLDKIIEHQADTVFDS